MRVALTAIAIMMAGCGGSDFEDKCQSHCSQTCGEQAPTADAITQCKSQCTTESSNLESSGCMGKFETFASCAGDTIYECGGIDGPDVPSSCDTKLQAFAGCVDAYCRAHASAAICGQ